MYKLPTNNMMQRGNHYCEAVTTHSQMSTGCQLTEFT